MISRNIFIVKGFSQTSAERIVDEYYVTAYSEYFQLSAGGAYTQDEIIQFSEPTSFYLQQILDEQKLDFGIIIYIGHGANQDNNQLFQLNEKEIIKPGQFILKADKQIIILESCRIVTSNIYTVDLADKIPKFAKGGIFRWALTNEQSREIYDSHIKRCENGIMIWYACQLGDEAYNFIFSQALLQTAMDWHLDSSRHCAILPIDELSRLTWVETLINAKQQFGVQQFPHSEGNMNFPFAVSKF